jgi:hypothetical protein
MCACERVFIFGRAAGHHACSRTRKSSRQELSIFAELNPAFDESAVMN